MIPCPLGWADAHPPRPPSSIFPSTTSSFLLFPSTLGGGGASFLLFPSTSYFFLLYPSTSFPFLVEERGAHVLSRTVMSPDSSRKGKQ